MPEGIVYRLRLARPEAHPLSVSLTIPARRGNDSCALRVAAKAGDAQCERLEAWLPA